MCFVTEDPKMGSPIYWMLLYIVMLLCLICLAIYIYSRHAFAYFKRRGVPYEEPTFPLGNIWPVIMHKYSYSEMLRQIYQRNKGKKLVGFFQIFQKNVLIVDKELLKHVLVKDFEHFSGRSVHYNKDTEPLSAHLFALEGEEWKFLRKKMNPVFSSGKVKDMYGTIADISTNLLEHVTKLTSETDVINCKELFVRYGIAVISSIAFGIESDVFVSKKSTFYKVFVSVFSAELTSFLRNFFFFFGKKFAKPLKLRVIPKQTHDFITKLVQDVVEYREKNNKERNDVLQALMQIKQNKHSETNG